MELHLKITGWLLIGLALLHVAIPRYLNWPHGLSSLNLINKQITQVHLFFIALIILLMGLLCISSSKEILETSLGRTLSFGLFILWSTRLAFQFFVYSSTLWKGKTFETFVHILFAITWTYFSIVFFNSWMMIWH